MKSQAIAIFTWGLSGGAITNIVAALARGFADLGVKQIYILYIKDAPEQRVNFPEGVELVKLEAKQARWAFFSLAKFLRQYQPDFLISFGFLNLPAILAKLLAGKITTKLVISQQNSLIYQARYEHKGNFLIEAQLWLSSLLYSQVDGLVATTESVMKELKTQLHVSLPEQRMTVIPNMVDLDTVATKAQVESDRTWLQQKDKPVIVSVGRLAKQKNFPLLLEALSIVRQQIDTRLIIFGRGSEKQNLENLIKKLDLEEYVSLPGFAANPWSQMSKADVFVLPSEEEAFGLVLVEAMACGVPIVATDAMGDGPRSILADSKYGSLVPSHNSAALAQAILQVLQDSAFRHDLIDRGKNRCQDFRPAIVAQQWLDFLKNLPEK
jgi:glycosyltransferase involved in cell wall biosynthesis